MSNGWHRCHLCDCEFFDESTSGYWGWCPDCREEKPRKEPKMKSALKSMSNTELQMAAHKYPMPNPFSDEISRRDRKHSRKALKVAK